jgi:hypothetical protein
LPNLASAHEQRFADFEAPTWFAVFLSRGASELIIAVVGSGIMAAKLAGRNGAVALLCNTIPTGAILVVLILIFEPLSGAHFNPAVSLAFALRGELPWSTAALYMAAQALGAIAGRMDRASHVRTAAVAIVDHGAHGPGAMAGGSGGHLRPAADDLRMRRADADGRALCGRPLYHFGLLVHGLLHRGPGRRHVDGRRRRRAAVADAGKRLGTTTGWVPPRNCPIVGRTGNRATKIRTLAIERPFPGRANLQDEAVFRVAFLAVAALINLGGLQPWTLIVIPRSANRKRTLKGYLNELNAQVEEARAVKQAQAAAAHDRLTSLDGRLQHLLSTIPPEVQAAGLSIVALLHHVQSDHSS